MMFHGMPLECINYAAITFRIPATIIVSIMQTENGWNGAAIKNKDGTEDLGVFQVNSRWLKLLKKQRINREDLQFNPCINVYVATWIMAQGLAKNQGWQGIANYHSRTLIHNLHYRHKVQLAYAKINKALNEGMG